MAEISKTPAGGDVMVVMLHDVIDQRTKDSVWFDCTTDNLRAIIEWTVTQGGTFISMDDLYEHLTNGKRLPEKSVLLTFDDNYQGVRDNALPVLDEYEVPFTVFVHTDFVGDQRGHPKMTWDELKDLIANHRCTVGNHTASHPLDFTKYSPDKQLADLQRAEDAIYDNLGVHTPYLAYADGKYNAVTMNAAQQIGIRMAFLMDSGAAEDSQSILQVNRVPFNKFFDYWDVMEAERSLNFATVSGDLDVSQPIREQRLEFKRGDYVALTGGQPHSLLADRRLTVPEFMKSSGAVAGINGGFFVMAAVAATDNQMMGPVKTENRPTFVPTGKEYDVARLRHRPLVVWGGGKYVIAPYFPGAMNQEDAVERLLPGFTDCFLAGAWLVVDGSPLSPEQILAHGAQDAEDPRRRAVLGFKADGTIVCICSLDSVPSSMAAQAAVAFGCKTAVLLDSGFSTSLVLGDEVLASGHSTKKQPSRPVPHAIVLTGSIDEASRSRLAPVPVEEETTPTTPTSQEKRRSNPDGAERTATKKAEPTKKTPVDKPPVKVYPPDDQPGQGAGLPVTPPKEKTNGGGNGHH